jgi:hypothetical protein
LELPRIHEEDVPLVRAIFAGGRHAGGGVQPAGGVWLAAKLLHRFEVAARCYGSSLVLDAMAPAGGAWLVRAGDSFLGAITTVRPDEDMQVYAADQVEAWGRRLADDPVSGAGADDGPDVRTLAAGDRTLLDENGDEGVRS